MQDGIVYASFDENFEMYTLFPKPSKIKSFKKDQFKDNVRDYIGSNDDHYGFVFRNEFENCGKEIKGDIVLFMQNKNYRAKRKKEQEEKVLAVALKYFYI